MAAPFQTTQEQPAPAAWPLDRIEVRFDSDAAFARGLALAEAGGDVTVCQTDAARRRLVLRLGRTARSERPTLH